MTSEQEQKADQTPELYDCSGLCNLERTSRFCRRARYSQLGRFDAENERRDDHPVELGK